jgi:hypothetical protein
MEHGEINTMITNFTKLEGSIKQIHTANKNIRSTLGCLTCSALGGVIALPTLRYWPPRSNRFIEAMASNAAC